MVINCPFCKSEVNNGDTFCSNCGNTLQKCPTCNKFLTGTRKYCSSCGEKIEEKDISKSKIRLPKQAQESHCEECIHFRILPLRVSQYQYGAYGAGIGKAVDEALREIRNQENKILENETALKMDLINNKIVRWRYRPYMSDFCAKNSNRNIYEIAELKNYDSRCSDYEKGVPPNNDCRSCIHRIFNHLRYSYLGAEGFKDKEGYRRAMDALYAEHGNEIALLFAEKGRMRMLVKFHEYCNEKKMSLPHANINLDCEEYEEKELYNGSILGDH